MRQLLLGLTALALILGLLSQSPHLLHAQSTDQIAVVGARGARIYDSPDDMPNDRSTATPQNAAQENNAQSGGIALAPGALLMIQGRSADSLSLYVQTETRATGWVAARSLLVVNINSLPVVEQLATPMAAMDADSTSADPSVEELPQTSTDSGTELTLLATPTPMKDREAVTAVTSSVTAIVTLSTNRLNLRAGPATSYPILAKAEPGSRWIVTGQTKAGDWLELRALDASEQGWATMAYLALEGSGALPVVTDFPPSPRLVPTSTSSANTLSIANGNGSTDSTDRTLLPTPESVVNTATTIAVQSDSTNALQPGKTGLSGTLAFQDRNGGTIYLYDLNRDSLQPLTNGIDPAISPDGQWIAFTRDGGEGGLYIINRDGSGERRIYNDHPLLRSPSWSPDGQWIVFSRANGYEDCRVVRGSVCLPDDAIIESLPEGLQNDAEVHNLVKGIPNQRTYHTSLARIAPDGSGYRDIPALDYAAAPDWNRAGIVYQSNAGIQRTADEADARSIEIAHDPLVGYFHDPDWQPTASNAWGRIVFHRKQGSHWQIYAVNPDGGGLVALTRPVTALVDELPSNVSPAWSPDGNYIIYLSNRNSIESAGAWHFWVMNADGSEQRMLPIDIVLAYSFSSEQMVSWAK